LEGRFAIPVRRASREESFSRAVSHFLIIAAHSAVSDGREESPRIVPETIRRFLLSVSLLAISSEAGSMKASVTGAFLMPLRIFEM